tara:strand:+ start:252 stop:1358 length:1107 start_codon:yes stop_codon:yes gene_type:complete
MDKKGSCILSTGGTGGHVFPTVALAKSLIEQGWEVIIFSDNRGRDFLEKGSPDYEVQELSISSESISFFKKIFIYQYQMPVNFFKAFSLFLKIKPQFAVGFGGVSTAPVLLAALCLGVPLFLQEQNAVLGRVNKFFQKFSKIVFYHFEQTKFLDKTKSVHSGNPVRKAILGKENSQYLQPGTWPTTILVLGGSQGATLLSNIIPKALSQLSEAIKRRITVFHQARIEDIEKVNFSYKKIGVKANVDIFFENIDELISEAQLIISRAGANTLTDISVIGRPAIFIPLSSAKDDHQRINARIFEENGAAISIQENEISPKNLSCVISKILKSPSKALKMAKYSYAMSKPKASTKIISEIEKMIGRQIDCN